MRISKIILYDEPNVPEIKITELAEFLNKKTDLNVEIRGNFLNHFNVNQKTAPQIASCKVLNPYIPFESHKPSIDEVIFEEEFSDKAASDNIILYDGFELQNVLKNVIPESELDDVLHLVFTTRLTCTFDYNDHRYHGRAVICSNPSIISITGLIEAPAKPREYYLRLQEKYFQGLNIDAIKDEFRGRFLEYHDKNLALVVRGYAMQTVFYYITGQAFCESKDCMLYNAHWQEDLLHSQIESGVLCEQHEKLLKLNDVFL